MCGLIYVGETKGRLNTRMCGHRSSVNSEKYQLVYKHFNQPYHSIRSVKVRILEKNITLLTLEHLSVNREKNTGYDNLDSQFHMVATTVSKVLVTFQAQIVVR